MGSDGYQGALRHKQQEDVTPNRRPFLRVYQRERLAVIFCSDLPVKRCE